MTTLSDVLNWPAHDDCREPNWPESWWLGEPVSAATCVVFSLGSVAFAAQFWSPAGIDKAHRRELRILFLLHLASGLSGFAYHASLRWIAQFVDRVCVALWPLWFAHCLLLDTPVEADRTLLPVGPAERRRWHLVAAVIFTFLCCVLNLWQAPFPLFSLASFYVLFVENLGRGNVKKSMRRDAVLGSVRGVAALGFFVLDGWHSFDYWHAVWHLAAMTTITGQSWLVAHFQFLASERKRLS